ncbi:nodulin-26-like [Coffea eugenioides]|uniref:nodulin-26-like n=1 Tax=Coffea eugenioides TaxID=49369 RepID=UPI000F60731F|nr:nodulin-26-like [Coffea eugenioides]
MAYKPDSPSIVGMNSPTRNSRDDLNMVEQAKETVKRIMLAKKVPKLQSPSNYQKVISLLVGTYIFIFMGCGSALVDRITPLTIVGIGLIWGLVIMALIYALGHVSGAHFNPAVTIAFGAASRLPLVQVAIYVVSQLIGSTLACLTLRVLFHGQHDILPTHTQYRSSTSDLESIAWEFIITFILMFIICGAATDDRSNKALSGVATGVTMLFNVIIAGPITGASMNPGRSIGPAIASGVNKKLWVFIVAPILGALAAMLAYSLLRMPEPKSEKEESTDVGHNDFYVHPDV